MSHYCIICGLNSNDTRDGISYHKIQAGKENEWLGFFGLDPEKMKCQVKNALFCNRHFTPSDFNVVGVTQKRVLKKNSTPSIRYIDDATFNTRKLRLIKRDEDIDDLSKVNLTFSEYITNVTRIKNRGKSCIYCRDRTLPGLSLFSFPKDDRRKLWIDACGLKDPVPKQAFLCSIHFDRLSFCKLPGRGRAILELTAIPTLFSHESDKADVATAETNGAYLENEKELNTQSLPNVQLENKAKRVLPQNGTESEAKDSRINDVLDHSYACKSPLKTGRKPRYPGDINIEQIGNTADIDNYKLMKSIIEQQRHKIHILQKRLTRRTKRIESLEQTVKELRKKNAISENVAEQVIIFQ